jgi:lysine 6-dehydrogenase
MAKILVLGAGMVGRAMAADLCGNHTVTSADINPDNLKLLAKYNVSTIEANLGDKTKLKALISDYDLIVGAVPGFMGYETVKTCIESGKNIIDISFFPEDSLTLDALAKENNVTAIVDCGVAPGMSNLIIGYHHKRMIVEDFRCYVGGLPFKRDFPFQYKAPFSPIDVLEEYTRPARYVENFNLITKPALSDTEYISFDEVGTLEAFNSDGLRTIIDTVKARNMIEKTLRYPNHIEYIQVLKGAGFFSTDEIEINGIKTNPMAFTSKILFDKWKLRDEDDEFTIMRIIVAGNEDGKHVQYTYDLFDRRDKASGISSMSRTTGYACTAAVEMFLSGLFTKKGVFPPELIGDDENCFNYIIDYQKQRGINYRVTKV